MGDRGFDREGEVDRSLFAVAPRPLPHSRRRWGNKFPVGTLSTNSYEIFALPSTAASPFLPSTHSFHFTTVRRPRRRHRRRNGLFYCTLSDHPQGKEEVPSFLSLHNFPFPGKKARGRRLRTMWEREARRSYISTAPFLIESSELGKEWEKGGGRKALSGSGCALLSSFTSTSPVLLASPLFQTFP